MPNTSPATIDDVTLHALAQRLRRDCLISTAEAGSGHPTTCMSAAEIVAVLFGREMAFDPQDPNRPGTDHFVLSKGHAAPILWAILKHVGAIDYDLNTLRRIDSPLEGHPTPHVPGWVKVATGSLGQGLSASIGMGFARRLRHDPGRIYCLMGDGEIAEGAVWEAAEIGWTEKLPNVCAIVDANGLGQSGPTMHDHRMEEICGKWRAFGWHAIAVDGHDVAALTRAFEEARAYVDGPSVLVCKTLKGKGAKVVEGKEGWHGKPLKGKELDQALAEVGDPPLSLHIEERTRGEAGPRPAGAPLEAPPPPYKVGDEAAAREAWGEALVRLGGSDPRIIALDAEVKNSTFSDKFKAKYPQRFLEGYIAEQNMIGAALGMAGEGFVPCASTFAAFFTRAFDFIRMAAYSAPPHMVLCGTHVGVSIGEDGPSQMGLEDVAMMRAVIGSTVLSPSDAVCAYRLVCEAVKTPGVVYLRMARPKTPVLYDPGEPFPIGGSKTLRRSDDDAVTVVAAGVTVFEALQAHQILADEGVAIRVIDAYSIKPLDVNTLAKAAAETRGIVTVEDHNIWGGLGEAVATAVRAPVTILGVKETPRSGKPSELMARHGIDAAAIMKAVRGFLAG